MMTFEIGEPGILLFLPGRELPKFDAPGPAPGFAPLPHSANDQGWPTYIRGLHSDNQPFWYYLYNDAIPTDKQCARYQRMYSKPGEKLQVDGVNLWAPREGQQQGSCTFEALSYD